jgi:hypothetical protein
MRTLKIKQEKELNDILNSDSFNNLFDFEAEKKEIVEAGWTYKELQSFAKQLSKKIK